MSKEAKTQARFFKAEVKELQKEITDLDTKLPLYKNGRDNLYPERIERIIDASPTAKSAIKKFRKYTVGRGIEAINDKIVNEEKQQTFFGFLNDLGDSYCRQKGAFIHVKYKAVADFKKDEKEVSPDLKFTIASWDVIPYKYGRIGKKDDKGHSGKIGIFEKWDTDQGNPKADSIKWIDVFNPRQDVIKSQIKKCAGENIGDKIKNYKGQILYFNPENSIYPLSHIDQAYHDADTEHRMAIFKNTSIREGFMGITYIATPPLMGKYSDVTDSELGEMREDEHNKDYELYKKAKDEAESTAEVIKSTLGAENSGRVVHIQLQPGDDFKSMEDTFYVKTVETNIKTDMFREWESACANNIRKSINSIPAILLEKNEGSLFGNSGEMLKEAKRTFQEECEEDRMLIEGVLRKLFKFTEGFESVETSLKLLVPESKEEPQVEPQ